MNAENILKVADAIEAAITTKTGLNGVLGFNMASFVNTEPTGYKDHVDNCGTTACIAGWAYAIKTQATPEAMKDIISAEGRVGSGSYNKIPNTARDFLDLDQDQADDLFMSDYAPIELYDIKPQTAVRVLRHLAATGEVDWNV